MQNLTEIQEFLLFFAEGIIISFIFDFFRSIRNNFNSNDIVTFVEDLVFLSLVSAMIIITIINICNGIVRLYMFLGIGLGIIIYALTISKKCVIIFTNSIKIIKSFFTFLLKIVKKLGKYFKL